MLESTSIAGYAAEAVPFAHAGVSLQVFQVANLEDLVDRHALLSEATVPDPPYWAHLWTGARALARSLAEGPDLHGRRVLDLGCGLGLTGLVAAARGGEVWFVDREPTALEFVRRSAERNRLDAAHCRALDFTRDDLAIDFDVILGAEVVYDPQSYLPLCGFLERHLTRDGVIHLTDAFRSDAERFFAELARRGFRSERFARREWEEGKPHGLFLLTFRRAG